MPMFREMYVAEDRATAYEESRPYLESKYAAYAAWGQDKALPGEESFAVPFEDLARDRFLIGSPDDIVEEIRPLPERPRRELHHLPHAVAWPAAGESAETARLTAGGGRPKDKAVVWKALEERCFSLESQSPYWDWCSRWGQRCRSSGVCPAILYFGAATPLSISGSPHQSCQYRANRAAEHSLPPVQIESSLHPVHRCQLKLRHFHRVNRRQVVY